MLAIIVTLIGLAGYPQPVAALAEISADDLQAVSRSLGFLETLPKDGTIAVGDRRKSVTTKRTPLFTDEATECVERSGFLGRWFATSGPAVNIFSAWGVAP